MCRSKSLSVQTSSNILGFPLGLCCTVVYCFQQVTSCFVCSYDEEALDFMDGKGPAMDAGTPVTRVVKEVKRNWWLWGAVGFALVLITGVVMFRHKLYNTGNFGLPFLAGALSSSLTLLWQSMHSKLKSSTTVKVVISTDILTCGESFAVIPSYPELFATSPVAVHAISRHM